jgi:GNAT superfamily N-acetyltransferase
MNATAVRIAAALRGHGRPDPLRRLGARVGVRASMSRCLTPGRPRARVLALPTLPGADALANVSTCAGGPITALDSHGARRGRAEGRRLPAVGPDAVLILRSQPTSRPRPLAEIGPARDREEFLIPYGADLAPLVTDAHLAAKHMHHLVARVDGEPVGCARVRLMGDTGYVGAITVLRAWQGKGLGTALTIASGETRRALHRPRLASLHTVFAGTLRTPRIQPRRDDHVLLVRNSLGTGA